MNLFDRLHVGHHVLLDRLSEMPGPTAVVADGEVVSEGLELVELVQPVDIREQRLRAYLRCNHLDTTIEVLVVSRFNDFLLEPQPLDILMFEGPCCAEIEARVLELRRSSGIEDRFTLMKPVRASDGDKLSSARVRKGELDREGNVLRGTSERARRLELGGREILKAPKGDLYHTNDGPPEQRVAARLSKERPPHVIAVGDVTCSTVTRAGYQPDVCVVDGSTKRGEFKLDIKADKSYVVFNPAATIYPESWSAIDTALHDKRKSIIYVEGEEDLLGFPAVLLAPKGSVMLYGQPDAGIVYVRVNKENKSAARTLLDHMTVIKVAPTASH